MKTNTTAAAVSLAEAAAAQDQIRRRRSDEARDQGPDCDRKLIGLVADSAVRGDHERDGDAREHPVGEAVGHQRHPA